MGLAQDAHMKSGPLSRCPFGAGRDKLAPAMGGPEIPPTQVPLGLPQGVAKRLLEAWRGGGGGRGVVGGPGAPGEGGRRGRGPRGKGRGGEKPPPPGGGPP